MAEDDKIIPDDTGTEQVPDTVDDLISDESLETDKEDFKDSDSKKFSFIRKVMDLAKSNRTTPEDDYDDTADDMDEDSVDDTEAENQEATDDTGETPTEEDVDEDAEQKLTIDKVDSRLVKAARRRGWGDEKILSYADSDITVLEDLAFFMDRIDNTTEATPQDKTDDQPEEKPKAGAVKKIEFSDEQKADLESKYGDGLYDAVIAPILNANNQLVETVNALADKDTRAETESQKVAMRKSADTFMQKMDTLEGDHPELGKWENVPPLPDGGLDMNNPVVKLRAELYEVFQSFMGLGYDADKAAEKVALLYTAEKGTHTAEKKVVEDLNKRKKKFVNRPGRRKVEKKFESADDMKRSVIQEAMHKAGIQRD